MARRNHAPTGCDRTERILRSPRAIHARRRNAMIVVSGVFEVDPSDREVAAAAATRMAAETRKEAGCQSYAFYLDIEDATRICVFEERESGEALARHFRTPH